LQRNFKQLQKKKTNLIHTPAIIIIIIIIITIMSTLAGRQSPDPERQTGPQQQDIPGSGKTIRESERSSSSSSSAASASASASASDAQELEKKKKKSKSKSKYSDQAKASTTTLESNPVHPLEEVAKSSTSTTTK
jgi:hypothetical protein